MNAPARLPACPCCGAPVTPERALDLALRSYPRTFRRIVRAIHASPGLTIDQIAARVWAHDPEGGPLYARETINSYISKQRARLEADGWQIVVGRGPGASYRIEPVRARAAAMGPQA